MKPDKEYSNQKTNYISEKYPAHLIFREIGMRKDCRLFRNNVGRGYQGKVIKEDRAAKIVTLKNYRRIQFGLFKGSSDYIGFKQITITPEMVGQKVAVFTAIETKSPDNRNRPKEQRAFISFVKDFGGFAGFANCIEDALRIIGIKSH